MIDTAIIGYNGFVGSFINEKINNSDNYNSSNIEDIRNKSYKTIYFAGLPAQKWLINQKPQEDLENINKIIDCLNTVTCEMFYLFSTIDVYDKNNNQKITEEPYGKNRFYFEQYVIGKYKNHRIIRLPALFGIGLKKNMIYDVINENQTEKINTNINYQWYNMHDLWHDIHVNVKTNNIFNFFSPTINTKSIIENCFGQEKLKALEKNNFSANAKSYEIKVSSLIKGTTNIIRKMKKFISVDKVKNNNNLSVSCISWKKQDEKKIPFILERYGIRKIEIAPTRYFDWHDNEKTIKNNTKHLTNAGIEFYSMQSLFNGIDVNLFNQKDKFIDHFKRVADIASLLGTKRLVYGSPNTRITKENDSNGAFVDTFAEISEYIDKTDIIICIEPNSKKYQCNYLWNFNQVVDIIQQINKLNIKINFDSGNAALEDDCEYKIINDLTNVAHAHISKPYLAKIENIDYIKIFKKLINDMVVNIEMKEIDFEFISDVLYNVISEIYGNQ